MLIASVQLDDSQIEELILNVDISDHVQFMTMDEWNDYMDGMKATEIINSIDMNHFDTCDSYAVMDGHGSWVSSDDLQEILEPFLDDMLQDYLDSNLK